jgi:hypothetical protein
MLAGDTTPECRYATDTGHGRRARPVVRTPDAHNGVMAKKSWAELPPRVRTIIIAAGAVELALLAAAQIDITLRPSDRIRGSKLRWRLVSLLNVVGPILYFWRGRIAGPADGSGDPATER